MTRESIHFTEYYPAIVRSLSSSGLLLGSYDTEGEPNVMTIGWGVLGFIWGKPIWVVLVRPSRYTHSCIEHSRCFTINVPTAQMADVCQLCGTHSGRDTDKFANFGITAERAATVRAPVVTECPIVYECQVVHSNDVLAPSLSEEIVQGAYRGGDFHRCFWGEVLLARADRGAAEKLG